MSKHKHHVMPKHLGGTNHPDNIVEVTAEEHSKIHHSLWILGGRIQDYIAWKALSKQIGKEEIYRLTGEISGRKSKGRKMPPRTLEHKQKLAAAIRGKIRYDMIGDNNPAKRPEVRKKISSKMRGRDAYWAAGNQNTRGKTWKLTEETKQKQRKPKEIVKCPHCPKTGGIGIMKRWHFGNCPTKTPVSPSLS